MRRCDEETYEPEIDDYEYQQEQYEQDPFEDEHCYSEDEIIINSYPDLAERKQ